MLNSVIISLISAASAIIVALLYIHEESKKHKNDYQSKFDLVIYKIEQLEEAQKKHNTVIERLTKLETIVDSEFRTIWKRYDELNNKIK